MIIPVFNYHYRQSMRQQDTEDNNNDEDRHDHKHDALGHRISGPGRLKPIPIPRS